MNRERVIFLDIDGTLVGFDGKIPASTIEALKKARKAGHHLVICSGRSRFQVDPALLSRGFDGVVGAAGAFVDLEGREVYHAYVTEEKRRELAEFMDVHQVTYSMQASDGMRMNQRSADLLLQRYRGYHLSEERIQRLIGRIQIVPDTWNSPYIEKAIYYDSPFTVQEMQDRLAPYFDVIGSSFEKPDPYCGEIGIAGITKATGMQHYLEAADIEKERSIAFGDGPNDIEMLQYAQIGVAMGNAQDTVKKVADYVTSRIDEDGIARAFEHFGLI